MLARQGRIGKSYGFIPINTHVELRRTDVSQHRLIVLITLQEIAARAADAIRILGK